MFVNFIDNEKRMPDFKIFLLEYIVVQVFTFKIVKEPDTLFMTSNLCLKVSMSHISERDRNV